MGWIQFNNGSAVVNPMKLKTWFDTWLDEMRWKGIVDGEDIIQRIADRISRHTHDIGSREEGVHSDLRTLLVQDVQVGQSSGTKKTRQTFLILTCLARITKSDRLAEALSDYLGQHVLYIVRHEKSGRYGEWIAALQELRGLEDDATLNGLIAYFLRWDPTTRYNLPTQRFYEARRAAKLAKDLLEAFEPSDYRRGRRDRRLRPCCWPARARSAPAYGYDGYMPDIRIGFPIPIPLPLHRHRYLPPASSTIPLPLALPAIEYPDNYDELRAEQDVQADEVDDLRWRVRRLELTQ